MQVEDNLMNFQNDFQKLHIKDKEVKESRFEEVIKKIANKEGYLKYIVKEEKIEPDGGNYLGELYTLDIQGVTREGNKETNIFVKQCLSECKLSLVDIENVYAKEIYVYKELSKIYEQLQEKANIPQNERLKMVKCFYTNNNETVFLENMNKKGYSVPNRLEIISLDYAESAIKDLAKLHGLSFAVEKKDPDYFNDKLRSMDYPFNLNEDWNEFAVESIRRAVSILTTVEDQNRLETVIDKVESFYFRDLLKDKNKARVICHGDYRSNNILAKRTITGETNTIPIDYQSLFYGNPMVDFHYFIFGATDKEFRIQNLNYLKELYYTTLENFLKYFDIKIENVYPRKAFDEDYHKILEYGLMMATVLLPFLLAPKDEFPDFQDTDLKNMKIILTDQYKERMREVYEEFVEWGFI